MTKIPALTMACPASGGILFSRAKKVCKNARGNQWFPPFLARLWLYNVGSAYIANWNAATSGQRQELTQRLTRSAAHLSATVELPAPTAAGRGRPALQKGCAGRADPARRHRRTYSYILERCGSGKRSRVSATFRLVFVGNSCRKKEVKEPSVPYGASLGTFFRCLKESTSSKTGHAFSFVGTSSASAGRISPRFCLCKTTPFRQERSIHPLHPQRRPQGIGHQGAALQVLTAQVHGGGRTVCGGGVAVEAAVGAAGGIEGLLIGPAA